jgi:hypothetical protein
VLKAGSLSIASTGRRGDTPKRIGPVASDFVTKNVIVPLSAVHDGCQGKEVAELPGYPVVMKKLLALALFLVATTAFAHAGHQHHFLGTVKSLQNTQLVITTTAGKDAAFMLTPTTAVTRDGATVARTELTAGRRVAVEVANDGKTAVSVKVGK